MGHSITNAVGGITKNNDIGADIEVAHVIRGWPLANDPGVGLAHTPEALAARAFNADVYSATVMLQAAADIMLAVCFKNKVVGFNDSFLDKLLKFLGTDPPAIFIHPFNT